MSRLNSFSQAALCFGLFISLFAVAQVRGAQEFVAEVTVARVNVRSGPSTNYYVVTRLKAGERVHVAGEENEWYAIVPPATCYSLISKHYVDVGADGEGVVNGNAVRVRAGSELDSHRYAVQLKLNKGAEVKVLGEAADGFLKIVPPQGAHLWVHRDYLARVPQEMLGAETTVQRASVIPPNEPADQAVLPGEDPASSTAKARDAEPVAVREEAEKAPARPATAVREEREDSPSPSEYLAQLQAADEAMRSEMAKPVRQRRLEKVAKLYSPIAAQDADTFARLYARRRLGQLENAAATVEAVRRVHTLTDEVIKGRKEALAARSSMRPAVRPIRRGFDAKGELRKSMIYASPVGPRRYRLIAPDLVVPRTLCYLEIPRDSDLDVSEYLGRLVGVRAAEEFLETGDVNPIPIIVVEELVVLDESDRTEDAPSIGEGEQADEDDGEPLAAATPVDTPPDGE